MNHDLYNQLWEANFSELNDPESFPHTRPMLAHYTSIEVFELILKTEEIWLSNPLFMNDWEELRFGTNEGARAFYGCKALESACKTSARYDRLVDAFSHYLDEFSNKNALDIYAFCLSRHEKEDNQDGRLSMWRGYGGNGKGVAIVFDTEKLDPTPSSPFIVSRVRYESTAQRLEWLNKKMLETGSLIEQLEVSDDDLYLVAYVLFERIKLAALFSKHDGFKEEKEWRIVYLKDRDKENKFTTSFGHVITGRGVEPKLRYKICPIEGVTAPDFSLSKLIYQIILGPSISHRLAHESVLRLMDNIKKSELKERVTCSRIPYRPAI